MKIRCAKLFLTIAFCALSLLLLTGASPPSLQNPEEGEKSARSGTLAELSAEIPREKLNEGSGQTASERPPESSGQEPLAGQAEGATAGPVESHAEAALESARESGETSSTPSTILSFSDCSTNYFYQLPSGGMTVLTLEADGSFSGISSFFQRDEEELGSGQDVESALLVSRFSGRFTELTKKDQNVFHMKLEQLTYERTPGEEESEDGSLIRYIEAKGLTGGAEFLLYTEGALLSSLPDELLQALDLTDTKRQTMPMGVCGIYHVSDHASFAGLLEDSFYEALYESRFQNASVILIPIYSGKSSLAFLSGQDSSKSLCFEFEWDSDEQTVFSAEEAYGKPFQCEIHAAFDQEKDAFHVRACSSQGIDFSPWGGSASGDFEGTLVRVDLEDEAGEPEEERTEDLETNRREDPELAEGPEGPEEVSPAFAGDEAKNQPSGILLDGSFFVNGQAVWSETGYLLPQSSSSYLTQADLSHLTAKGICYAKNEIYARHHRLFNAQELLDYFYAMPWYSGTILPSDFTDAYVNQVFNEFEVRNASFLTEVQEINGAYQPH